MVDVHDNSTSLDSSGDRKYVLYAYVLPSTIGLGVWITGSMRAWQTQLDMYWGINFLDIVLWTVGVHAIMMTVLLSLIFKLGHLSKTRRLPVRSYLIPIMFGVSIIGIVPYDINVVAKGGIGGILLIPLFWVLVILTCMYLALLKDRP